MTLDVVAPKPVELDEYLAFVSHDVDPKCRDSVIASATMLQGLSQNKRLLMETLHRDLISSAEGHDSRFYSAHSFVLGSACGMTVRANIWPTVEMFKNSAHRQSHVDRVYAYNYPHDHNFDFLTVGWFGPGYVTDIYEYDFESVSGFDGEETELRFLERTSLCDGKIMLFREGRDVHVQYPPNEISVSLNLLVRTPLTAIREQFIFDIGNRRIATMATGSDVARTVLAVRFTAVLGDKSSMEVLCRLAHESMSGRVRASAFEAMLAIEPTVKDEVVRLAANDTSPHVKRFISSMAQS